MKGNRVNMNEEEIKRIKYLIERCNECKLNACIICDICWSEVQAIEKMYNLMEKQKDRILELEKALIEEDYKNREEIKDLKKSVDYTYEAYQDAGKKMFEYAEELEQLKRDFEIVDHECSRLEQEDIKKDKMIELMAERLTTPIHSKEWVIDYYKREIEK